jgi:hypothetical protein
MMTSQKRTKLGVLILAVVCSLGGARAAAQFSPEITLAINQLVTGVTPFTALRAAASSYLNWGSTQGTNGYGFRDSAGTIQVKNSGGAWANIVTGATLPTNASFLTRTADATLTNETALGTLTTGLLINTATTGLPTIYAGATCTNQFVRALSAIGAATCATVSLTADVTGTLAVARGGTGLTAGVPGGVLYFNGATTTIASSAALSTNQIVLGGGTAAPTTLGSVGTTATVLTGNAAGAPTWSLLDLATTVTGILAGANGGTGNGFMVFSGPAASEKTFTLPNASATILTSNTAVTPAQGGTGITSYTIGDLVYATGATTLAKLADIATGNVLLSGGIGVAPAYGKVGLTTHVTGTLPVANGGTGLATYVVGDVIYASGVTTLARLASSNTGKFLRASGAGVAPTWSTLILPNAASIGDLPVGTSSNVVSMLTSVTAGRFLRSSGVNVSLAWSTTVWTNSATTGDMLYASSANTYANLAAGATGTVLTGGSTPSWSATPSLTSVAVVSYAATAAAVSNTVYTLASTATADDPTEILAQYRVATTDATPTQLALVTVPASTTLQFFCTVTARRTGGAAGTAEDGAAYLIQVVYKNVAGNATEIAAETLTVIGEDQAAWTIAWAPSGASAALSVTGEVANNVTWHGTCRRYAVGS